MTNEERRKAALRAAETFADVANNNRAHCKLVEGTSLAKFIPRWLEDAENLDRVADLWRAEAIRVSK